MDIVKNLTIRKKYFEGYNRTKPIKYIVLHGTGGGNSARALLNWMANPNDAQKARYRKGVALFHYLIDKTGAIHEIIDPDKWVYHASIGKMDGGTIGIELLNPSRDNSKHYTPAQYAALWSLIENLRERYKSIEKIISHRYAKAILGKGKHKNCPGNFDWSLLANAVLSDGAEPVKVDPKNEDCITLT